MEKIQFKDLPSMETPLSSANLNQMQDNMEDAIIPIKLVTISDTPPGTATTGDMYYNTTDNKVYTATAENTWDGGKTPRYDGFYINIETNLMYYYNGTSLIKSGGDIAPIVKNEETTSETDVYSCNYINNMRKVLWTNSNPSQEMGDNVIINLSSNDYDELEWVCAYSTSNSNNFSASCLKGNSILISIASYTDGVLLRRIIDRVSDTQYKTQVAKRATADTSAHVIPVKVIGIKNS